MTREPLGATMRVLRPARFLLAFYDGRLGDRRVWSDEPNWVDDGAYALGACSYAVVDGAEALVYDTHMSLAHAMVVRRTLEDAGVRSIRIVLSHWHADHVAGNAVFADCPIIANTLTAHILAERKDALESGTPPIRPLVLPTQTFDEEMSLTVGSIPVVLRQFDIHSQDGTVLMLPETGTLLAGDTLEDPITYVSEPNRLDQHLVGLDRLARETVDRILPNHGSDAVIADGGYGRALIDATRRYVERLLRCRDDAALAQADLRQFVREDLAAGTIHYLAAYEAVHRRNVERCVQPR